MSSDQKKKKKDPAQKNKTPAGEEAKHGEHKKSDDDCGCE